MGNYAAAFRNNMGNENGGFAGPPRREIGGPPVMAGPLAPVIGGAEAGPGPSMSKAVDSLRGIVGRGGPLPPVIGGSNPSVPAPSPYLGAASGFNPTPALDGGPLAAISGRIPRPGGLPPTPLRPGLNKMIPRPVSTDLSASTDLTQNQTPINQGPPLRRPRTYLT